MPDDGTVIDVRDLKKTYREGVFRRRQVQALQGATIRVGRGEIFGLLGPNGAGKTTLIKILLGIVRATGGEATMLGRAAGDRSARAKVGYLPESHRIPRHLTGNTALEYYGSLSQLPLSETRRKRPALLETVGLGKWGGTSVRNYSKGMLQRLGLAQAMLHDPELLILDEPTDGVDPVGRTEIRAVLQRLRDEGKTIFLNSHLLQEIELVCDRAAILINGRVRQSGKIDELTSQSTAETTFQLQGPEATIRRVLEPFAILSWQAEAEAEGRFAVAAGIEAQPEIDRAVDALRTEGVSICRLARRRRTLEQAFLDLVKEARAEG